MSTSPGSGQKVSSRFCRSCGRPGPFPTTEAHRCERCILKATERRKLFTRLYHRARRRATQRLVNAHKAEFDHCMDEELRRVSTEPDAIEFVRAVKADLAMPVEPTRT